MSAEEIFTRFASRVLFLKCDLSAEEAGLASGVLVSEDGIVVTNAHVVEGCRHVIATYISGTSRQSFEAALKYYDKRTDTAVLKLPKGGWDHFDLGPWVEYQQVPIGARVYAIGNPRGLEQTISEGIISGNRKEDGVSWIQHSAPISPGSSGGALIGSRGELLGINSFLLTNSQNLNFAVPSSTLARAVSAARSLTADAQYKLGLRYLTGDSVAQDYTAAAVWFRAAAAQGHPEAQTTLGGMYDLGQGVPQAYAEAAEWYRKAAEEGYARAQSYLGSLYEAGRGVPQDYAQAAEWYRKAAEEGFDLAQNNLGNLYEQGHGVPQDYAQATRWFRKAAENGDATAQVNLGVCYMNGEGVPQSYRESFFWIKVASMGKVGNEKPEDIQALAKSIGAHLTQSDLVQAEERVREWLASHPTGAQ
ncbi:MAG TPA: trypsin-like peptidase domain-containing protein [Bryobacteraceae bacterium]|nr:trypsin-like peptidase domain-containing protein [Bryobacteraceae bacterium]